VLGRVHFDLGRNIRRGKRLSQLVLCIWLALIDIARDRFLEI